MRATRRHGIVGFVRAGGSVIVGRALGVLVVEDAVWMHGIGLGAIVAEDDLNGVSHFRANERTDEAEMFPLRGLGFRVLNVRPCIRGTAPSRMTWKPVFQPVLRLGL